VILQHHPIIGVGLDNFVFVYTRYAGYAPRFHGYANGPHNIFLSIATELGVVGMLLFSAAVVSQLRSHRYRGLALENTGEMRVLACEAACYGILASAFFLDVLWMKAFWLCWILLAVVARAQHRVQTYQSAGSVT